MRYYTLSKDGTAKPEPSLMKWAHWFEQADRVVAIDETGDSAISTVFLGVDHSDGEGIPVLWETLVIGGHMDGEMDRCPGTIEDARAMHNGMVEEVKQTTER